MKSKDFFYYVLIFVVLVFLVFVVYYITSNKEAFFENPFIYGARKMGNVECSCVQYDETTGLPVAFSFNETTFEVFIIKEPIVPK